MKEKKSKVIANLNYILKEVWKVDKRLILLTLLFTFTSALFTLTTLVAQKLLIDALTNHESTKYILIILSAITFFLISFSYLTAWSKQHLVPHTFEMRMHFLFILYDKSMTIEYEYTENPQVLNHYYTAQAAFYGEQMGVEGVINSFISLMSSLLTFIGLAAILARINPLIIIVVILIVTVNYFAMHKTNCYEFSQKDNVALHQRQADFWNQTMMDYSYGKDIRLYRISDWISSLYKESRERVIAIGRGIRQRRMLDGFLEAILLSACELFTFIYFTLCVYRNEITIGDFSMFVSAIATLIVCVKSVVMNIAQIQLQSQSASQFTSFLDYPDTACYNGEEIHETNISIEMRKVNFIYPGSQSRTLKDISLSIRAGENLAIVGHNGAGKTTLVKLLLRLYNLNSGEILINGRPINSLDDETYRNLYAVVPQQTKLYGFTLAENVAMTDSATLDTERVYSVLQQVGFSKILERLPKGLDTPVLKVLDESGVDFSGGQTQLLGMARALYKDAPVMILDEPTAALDAISENLQYKMFSEIAKDKTTIFISHRLASTQFCDRIVFMEHGQIAEYGTHDELMRLKGHYAEMYDIQAKYYQSSKK